VKCWGNNNNGQVMLCRVFVTLLISVGTYVAFLCSSAIKHNMCLKLIIIQTSYLLCLLVWAAELGRLRQDRYIPV
jgi:hypothetical protein